MGVISSRIAVIPPVHGMDARDSLIWILFGFSLVDDLV